MPENPSTPDQGYSEALRTWQYANAGNLNARIQIHVQFSTNPYGLLHWIFDHFDLPATADILEIGCGSGALWKANAGRIPPGWRVTLTDFSAGMLAEAEKNLAGFLRESSFKVANAEGLPFKDASFNAVIANHMLYHVPNRPKAFAEFRRVLRPGGKLFASTNGKDHMLELYQMADQFGLQTQDTAREIFRVRQFALENGAEQLTPFFSNVQMDRYVDSLRITQVEPLVEYILSMFKPTEAAGHQANIEQFRQWAEAQISGQGAIVMRKDAGLFSATR